MENSGSVAKDRKEKEEPQRMDEHELSNVILGCAIEVHKKLGPGLLESAYEECNSFELSQAGLFVERQKALPLVYKDVRMECGYRLDIMVNKKVIVEIKAVEAITDIHCAQLLTYLRITGCKLGLLINFNVLKLSNGGIKRIVNNL
jgi:GxxExxY protein